MSYHLSDAEFVQDVEDTGDARYMLRCVAHELFHGFASKKLVQYYGDAVQGDSYLRSLLEENEWNRGIGPEEMFVKAVELYLAYRFSLYTEQEVFLLLDGLYGNSLPLTVVLLDALVRGPDCESGFDSWAQTKFRDGTIAIGHIDDQCDGVIPNYSTNCNKELSCHDEYLAKLREHGLY